MTKNLHSITIEEEVGGEICVDWRDLDTRRTWRFEKGNDMAKAVISELAACLGATNEEKNPVGVSMAHEGENN